MNAKDSDVEAMRKEFVTKEELYKELDIVMRVINILRNKINGDSNMKESIELLNLLANDVQKYES